MSLPTIRQEWNKYIEHQNIAHSTIIHLPGPRRYPYSMISHIITIKGTKSLFIDMVCKWVGKERERGGGGGGCATLYLVLGFLSYLF
jgi:hypothetical protein